jgi:hypothetical protein
MYVHKVSIFWFSKFIVLFILFIRKEIMIYKINIIMDSIIVILISYRFIIISIEGEFLSWKVVFQFIIDKI